MAIWKPAIQEWLGLYKQLCNLVKDADKKQPNLGRFFDYVTACVCRVGCGGDVALADYLELNLILSLMMREPTLSQEKIKLITAVQFSCLDVLSGKRELSIAVMMDMTIAICKIIESETKPEHADYSELLMLFREMTEILRIPSNLEDQVGIKFLCQLMTRLLDSLCDGPPFGNKGTDMDVVGIFDALVEILPLGSNTSMLNVTALNRRLARALTSACRQNDVKSLEILTEANMLLAFIPDPEDNDGIHNQLLKFNRLMINVLRLPPENEVLQMMIAVADLMILEKKRQVEVCPKPNQEAAQKDVETKRGDGKERSSKPNQDAAQKDVETKKGDGIQSSSKPNQDAAQKDVDTKQGDGKERSSKPVQDHGPSPGNALRAQTTSKGNEGLSPPQRELVVGGKEIVLTPTEKALVQKLLPEAKARKKAAKEEK